MFNWLGNLFPYSDLHSLNLDWLLSKMKETTKQAAQAVADSAKALAQVIEAKTAAQDAQTAAQNAQTAANNAQTAANNAADSAENAVNVAQAAKSAAQTAQNTANTAQSAAQTAQSAAQTANDGVETLSAKFPIKSGDIASKAVDPGKLTTDKSYLYLNEDDVTYTKLPKSGKLTIEQITAGVSINNDFFQRNLKTAFFQFRMKIYEDGLSSPDTVFICITSPVTYKTEFGVVAISPFTIVKLETNETYNGFFKLSKAHLTDGTTQITCKAVFETTPPFNNNTGFVIEIFPINTMLHTHA